MTIAPQIDKREQLLRDGYCLFEGILDNILLQQTRQISDALLAVLPTEHFDKQK